jgi:hypothetical protein
MKTVRACSFFVAAILAAASTSHATTSEVTLTMDDLPMQPVHGLVHPSGVQFIFMIGRTPSLEANYASGGPGSIVFVQDPSIEGPSNGMLSMTFPVATPILRFGVARSIPTATSALVELFDAANVSLGVTSMPLAPMPFFAEGQFNHSGPGVKRATVRFIAPDSRFALDNLVFSVVPEPSSCLFVCCAGLYWRARRRPLS